MQRSIICYQRDEKQIFSPSLFYSVRNISNKNRSKWRQRESENCLPPYKAKEESYLFGTNTSSIHKRDHTWASIDIKFVPYAAALFGISMKKITRHIFTVDCVQRLNTKSCVIARLNSEVWNRNEKKVFSDDKRSVIVLAVSKIFF